MYVYEVLVEWPEYRQTDFAEAELVAKRYSIRLVRSDERINLLDVIKNLETKSGERAIRVIPSLNWAKLMKAFMRISGKALTSEEAIELLEIYKKILNDSLRITGHAI